VSEQIFNGTSAQLGNPENQTTQNTAKQNNTLVQSPFTTLGQNEMGLFYNAPEPTSVTAIITLE